MSFFVPGWPKIQQSIDPRVIMRNGVQPSGPQVSAFVVGLLNHQLGHRFRRHFSKTILPSESVASATTADITTWRWMMRTMPNETQMRVRMAMIPAAVSVNDHPRAFVKITEDATSTVVYDAVFPYGLYHGPRSASPTTAYFDDYGYTSRLYTLDPDTLYRCELIQYDQSRVVGLSAYGMPRKDLDEDVDYCVDPSRFLVNQPIVEDQNRELLLTLSYLWKRHGSALTYSVPGTTAKTVTGTTETNLLDATTTWTSVTKGFKYPTLNKHSLETSLGGSPTYAVPVQIWCYASVAGGGTGAIRFRWGTGASDYIQITGIGSTGWHKAAGNIPGNADLKADLTGLCSTGGTTLSVYAAGMFDYSA